MTISATTQGIKPGVCLSTNRPANPFDGQVIYMTDVDQTAVWDGTQWTVLAPIAGGRNKVINGAMSVWQRGTSFAAASSYTADRFLVDSGTVTRQTGTGQFPYCLRIANSTGVNPAVRHAIELPAAGVAGLFTVGSTWTVSFWARTSTTVTSNLSFYAAFCDSNLVNNNQIVLDTALPVPTTSWARYSKTFTIGISPSGTNLAMSIVPFLNSGSYAGNFEITGIQLEEGAVATPFEFEDFSTTLAKCQRYYQKSYADAVVPLTAGDANGLVYASSYNSASQGHSIGQIIFQVPFRSAPTVTIYGYNPSTAGAVSNVQGTNLAAGSGNTQFITTKSANVWNNSGGTITPNLGGYLFHYVASAEL
jgi:hypothetical protein